MKEHKTRVLAVMFMTLMLVSLIPAWLVHLDDSPEVVEDMLPEEVLDSIVNQLGDVNLTNEYDKIWEPNNIRGSTHAIAVTDDNEWMATAGGYLNDREVHIYRWASNSYQYVPVCDAGDGIITGDVMDVDFMDADNNGRLEVVAGSTDGRVYVFEQLGLATDPFNFSSPAHQWELVWDSGLHIDAQIWSVLAYDIDHDSHDEIIAGAWDNKVYVFDYIGSSGYPYCPIEHWMDFEPVWDSGDTITGVVNSVAVVDSDADLCVEIVAGSQDSKVYLFEEIPCMDHFYALRWTSGDAIWKPVVSVTASQDLDDDAYGEIVVSAYGQGVYVFDYNSTTENFDVGKISQGIKSWERGISYPPLS
ncbi:MAG: FG-GAP-like repeat-containing protein, partial [Candidatus Thorarchaeota archaeon]